MSVFDYFDLTKRSSSGAGVAAPSSPAATSVAAPAGTAAGTVSAEAAPQRLTPGWQALIYCTLMASVLASRYIDLWRVGRADQFALNWGYLLFTAVVALVAFPVVYDKALATRGQPVLMQVALVFSTGMGWEKILATVSGH